MPILWDRSISCLIIQCCLLIASLKQSAVNNGVIAYIWEPRLYEKVED